MKRRRPREHWRIIKTRFGYKRVLINRGIKGKIKRKSKSKLNKLTEKRKKQVVNWVDKFWFNPEQRKKIEESINQQKEKEKERLKKQINKLKQKNFIEISEKIPLSNPVVKRLFKKKK
jgi:hypothetical protein